MKCQWASYLSILPPGLRQEVDRIGRNDLQELHLRLGRAPRMILGNRYEDVKGIVNQEDLNYVINQASQFSPWAAATASQGFLTAPGGHRIGICGQAVIQNDKVMGIRSPMSLCIRVARDFPGIANELKSIRDSILIIGPPGCGKTTLLRDYIRQRSMDNRYAIAVVDEREELFPNSNGSPCFDPGPNTDILYGASKSEGILMALKTMGPGCIAVDEITSETDCQSLMKAAWCGVDLVATAHATNLDHLLHSPVYKPLMDARVFRNVVCLSRDKSWYVKEVAA